MKLYVFKRIVEELSEESFARFKEYSSDYLSYYFDKNSDASKEVVLQSFGGYLAGVIGKNSIKDDDLFPKYFSFLIDYLDNRIDGTNEKVTKYYARAKKLVNEELKDINQLEDFTRIFLMLYSMEKDERIASMNEDVSSINCKDLIEKLKKDNPTNNLLEKTDNKLLQFVPEKVRKKADDLIDKVDDKQHEKQLRREKKKEYNFRLKKLEEGSIYELIERNKARDVYSLKNYACLVLYLIYLRIYDYENVLNEE